MDLDARLSPEALSALARARKKHFSYAVRYLVSPDDRLLVILGEAHVKLQEAHEIGREVVSAFELRGVESFPVRKVVGGRALWLLIHVPRLVLRALSFGLVKGSTITEAKALTHGHTFEIESTSEIPIGLHAGSLYLSALFAVFWLHVAQTLLQSFSARIDPRAAVLGTIAFLFQLHMFALVFAWLLRRWQWSWLIHPAIAILTLRDVIMAEGTVAMFRQHVEPSAAVVVMGRAHLPGYERELVEKHGFRPLV